MGQRSADVMAICDIETSKMRRPMSELGHLRQKKKSKR